MASNSRHTHFILAAGAIICAAFLGAIGVASAATLADFRAGPPEHRFDWPAGLNLAPDVDILVRGENRSTKPVMIIVRIDDGKSVGYATRFDLERTVPPGAFTLRASAGQLARNGRNGALDPSALRRMIVSAHGSGADVMITDVATETALALPEGARGFDFGPIGGAVFPGFEPVFPDDVRIEGKTRTAVRRPSGDPLVSDGVKGVEAFETPWPNGRWTVSLWIDDLGEWEYLPHVLNRRIRVNGVTAFETKFTPTEWIGQVYLAGRDAEVVSDPWAAFGRRRGGLVTVDVEVTDNRLRVELAGDTRDATYLAGMLVEPATESRSVLARVEGERRRRFLETWPVIGATRGVPAQALAVSALPDGGHFSADLVMPNADGALVSAPGLAAAIDFAVTSPEDDDAPQVSVQAASLDGHALPFELRWGQWRFTRHDPAQGALTLEADHLRANVAAMTLRADLPRRLNLLVKIPQDTKPGIYRGAVSVRSRTGAERREFTIDVVPVSLPEADRQVGVYLEHPPFLDWFASMGGLRDTALSCDLHVLRGLGLTGVAPPFPTPQPGQTQPLIDTLRAVEAAGFMGPPLAYAPVKRMIAAGGLSRLESVLRELRVTSSSPLWSIADEPGNPGSTASDLAAIRDVVRRADPAARVAAHLNHPRDRELLPLFDTVLVNTGYGLDAASFAEIRARGVTAWLYNMPDMALAAGFYGWRVGARGYLQWHGRSPTADPFDPTDGIEGDVQLLPPQQDLCAAVPDLDGRLLDIVKGIGDLRWLLWLDALAQTDPEAQALAKRFRDAIPAAWPHATTPRVHSAAMRAAMITLARNVAARKGANR